MILGAMALNEIKSDERRATSEVTKSNFEGFARERYKEKRADELLERFQRSNHNNGRKTHKKA